MNTGNATQGADADPLIQLSRVTDSECAKIIRRLVWNLRRDVYASTDPFHAAIARAVLDEIASIHKQLNGR